jgi:hypothetical protein
MVWHAYLLNPRQACLSSRPIPVELTVPGLIRSWYAEDTARISQLKPLTRFSDYFPTLLVRHNACIQLHLANQPHRRLIQAC